MNKRPPGRPKATSPKEIRVTVRLSAEEADLLQRMAREGSLSAALRLCLQRGIVSFGGVIPETPTAMIKRNLRTAKQAESPEDAQLLHAFTLDEPAGDLGQLTPVETQGAPRPRPIDPTAYTKAFKGL